MPDHCCKIGRTIDKYNLQESVIGSNIDDNLRARWVGENDFPEVATRPLCHWLNQKILKQVYSEHGRKTIQTHLEADYKALRSDDEVERGTVIDDLEADGIDGEELAKDFAKRSTMYRHLTKCLGIKKNKNSSGGDGNNSADQDGEADNAWEGGKIEYAKNAMEDNVQTALRSLERKGEIPNGTDADIQIPIILGCPVSGCSTQTRFNRARKQGYICAEHGDTEEIATDNTSNKETKNDSTTSNPSIDSDSKRHTTNPS